MFITIDPYYDNNFYNECLHALQNNNIEFREFVSTRAPFYFYLELPSSPLMTNYDEILDTRYLVSKVLPVLPNDETYLLRRNESRQIKKYILNDAFREENESDYAIFFSIPGVEAGRELTKNISGKVYYLGKYYSRKYRVCISTSPYVKTFIPKSWILLEKTQLHNQPGSFEAYFNYKVLLLKDRIIKYSQTPYFENGVYVRPNLIKDKQTIRL